MGRRALWAIVTGESKYVDFVKSRGTGCSAAVRAPAGSPLAPTTAIETCCLSDMMSIAAMVARDGHPEYFDPCRTVSCATTSATSSSSSRPSSRRITRKLNQAAGNHKIADGLNTSKTFKAESLAVPASNDYEEYAVGRRIRAFEMFCCCAPEGMRAIHTTWDERHRSLVSIEKLGPAGVYVNMSFGRQSRWGTVVSFFRTPGV